ncbi:unnamed protein product [Albugo candida]|uniref:Uncharacterized protein n=1 Tax=Albugo candida TaxID=65357 RepID=A0A024G099_9STRA|nr:unnamed protein product [Albugo candida]|eukprot:CCI40193.1 unnamed protein product [Albugo candida]
MISLYKKAVHVVLTQRVQIETLQERHELLAIAQALLLWNARKAIHFVHHYLRCYVAARNESESNSPSMRSRVPKQWHSRSWIPMTVPSAGNFIETVYLGSRE